MSRRPSRKSTGIFVPAAVALLCAALLLIGHRMGGDAQVDALLDAIANNRTFITSSIALETGVSVPEAAAPAAQPQAETPATAVAVESAPPPVDETDTAQTNTDTLPSPQDKRDTDISVRNDAGLSVDVDTMLNDPIDISVTADGSPQVLIYHTHSTEAYTPKGNDTYMASGDYRTRDTNQNVVRVGTELTKVLESRGIGVIHITDIFDDPAYNGSYGRSLTAAEQVLEQYPDIAVTIDLHRDAILNNDGSQYRVATTLDGQEVAQLMLVIGTDANGLSHPNWRDNMNFAVNLQADLNGAYPDLMRDVNLRSQRFNTHLRSGSILLECGSSGNTLQEAIRAVKLFGNVLADRLLA